MAYEDLCMYCFEDRGGESVCPHCGRDNRAAVPQIQMLPGTLVYHDRFLVGRALGQDATGIVYSAFDTKRENKLRLREYLPRDCAERLNDGTVVPIAGMEDDFEKGLKKLRASVEGVEDPRKRHFFFEENGTAYIAQRKSAAGAEEKPSRRSRDDEEERGGKRSVGLIIGIAAAVVLIAAVVIITLVNGALKSANDITQTPTLSPNEVWAPEVTPTPTPYVTPTFAALVDPEQSWMDYTYSGDVEEEYNQQIDAVRTPTPKPTVRPETTGYKTVSSKSSAEEIRALQQRLVTMGWLDYSGINGAYDNATRQAVKDFQSYINDVVNPSEKLDVDGIAGPKTLKWIYETEIVKPTPVPTPMVTPDPEQELTVDKDSSKNDIRAMQRKLIALGVMPQGSDDGVYGTTTTAAVKKFQQRVNQLQGFEVLDVSGVMDPLSMAFLNYYVQEWAEQQQATATPVPTASPAPTEAPTAAPTDIPDKEESGQEVNASSAKESIQFVQEMLIAVGLLPEGGNDGVYGSGTVSAVAKFQEWVNEQKQSQTLRVTGTADALTLSYLEYAYSNGMSAAPTAAPTEAPVEEPTEAPTAEPTEAPVEEPTEAPTEEPAPEVTDVPEDELVVDRNSPVESVRFVQEMLAQVGLLDADGADGIYGGGTEAAVRSFQEFVNSRLGEGTLEVTGVCDALTLNYLEEYSDSGVSAVPTAEPTAEPTEAPETKVLLNVNGAPATGEVVIVGENGIQFDWTSEGDVESYYIYVTDADGKSLYYKEATDRTSGSFSKSDLAAGVMYTLKVGALPQGGDEEDMVWSSVQFGVPAAPLATETPTAEPTEVPAVEVALNVNGAAASDGVIEVGEDGITFDWSADGAKEYAVSVTDPDGGSLYSAESTDRTSGAFRLSDLKPGVVYTIRVGTVDHNGEMVWASAQFAAPKAEEPTPEPTAEPTEAPKVGSVSGLSLQVNGESGDTVEITGDTCALSWSAEGDVAGYYVYVEDGNGQNVYSKENVRDTSVSVPAENIKPGEVYTLTVGVLPENGTDDDISWSSIRFTVPVEPTEAPTPEPTVAAVSKPEISIDGTAYKQDGVPYLTGSKAIFSWMADGALESYKVYMTNSAGDKKSLGNTSDTSVTINLSDLPADQYRIYVGAVPAGARSDEDIVWNSLHFGIPSPEPVETEAPKPTDPPKESAGWPSSLSAGSDSESIRLVQVKLYELGLLSQDGLEIGALDAPTLQAIARFQQLMNENHDLGLPGIDPSNPDSTIDSDTLAALKSASADSL